MKFEVGILYSQQDLDISQKQCITKQAFKIVFPHQIFFYVLNLYILIWGEATQAVKEQNNMDSFVKFP